MAFQSGRDEAVPAKRKGVRVNIIRYSGEVRLSAQLEVLVVQEQRFAHIAQFSSTVAFLTLLALFAGPAGAQQTLPNAPSAQKKATAQSSRPSDSGWPRTFTSGADTFVMYQPQVDKWDGNRVDLYSAVEFKAGKDSAAKYGVVWFQARTEVDKLNRLVTLDQGQLTKVKFPVAPEKEPELTALSGEEAAGRHQGDFARPDGGSVGGERRSHACRRCK